MKVGVAALGIDVLQKVALLATALFLWVALGDPFPTGCLQSLTHHLGRASNQLPKLDLPILDELGYVPATELENELLFEVISAANERTSVIVTTNLPFEQWAQDLGSHCLPGAALDRLTHHCHILEATGEKKTQESGWTIEADARRS